MCVGAHTVRPYGMCPVWRRKMDHKITLLPLEGIDFDHTRLSFGSTRTEAESALGPVQNVHRNRCYFFNGELALDFDGADRLEFIEFLGGPGGTLSPALFGLSVFDTDAQELLDLLEEKGGPADDVDGGYTVTVPSLSVGLYREISPADVEELVRAMSRMDVTTLGHVDLAAEQRRAQRWETIGIGRENYYT